MNAYTTLSAKGQIVIPKPTRDRMRMRPGQKFEVVETTEGVLLKRLPTKGRLPFEEAMARIRKVVSYQGPPVTIEEMNETIRQGWRDSALRSDRARD
jgi:AbrB family looped-hinge helix DNA binding protein